jgi:putative colanic acid biosynthesis glycosyltransferase
MPGKWSSELYCLQQNRPNQSSSELIKIGNKLDVYAHGIKTRVWDKHGFGSKKATRELLEEIDSVSPDVIGLHNLHGYYINIELLFDYLKKKDIPVLWTLHDCWAFTGHCSYFDSVGCRKWIEGCYECPKIRSYPASYFTDNSKENYLQKKDIFNGVNHLSIIAYSDWLKKLVGAIFS